MNIPSTDDAELQLHQHWGGRLTVARKQYLEAHSETARGEYLRVLRAFADLVMRGKVPKEQ
jgi:hypothetical protein